MVGFVVVTHGELGRALCICLEGILGSQEGVASVSVDFTKPAEEARAELEKAVQQVDAGQGVILFTDMFGGTPSNISLSFLERPGVEVLTGVNLPMLIKGIHLRKEHPLDRLCGLLAEAGCQGIVVAGRLLQERREGRG